MNGWIFLLSMAVLSLSISVALITHKQNNLRHQIWCMKRHEGRMPSAATIDDYVGASRTILELNKEIEDAKQQLKEAKESNAKLAERVQLLESELEAIKNSVC